MKLECHIAGGSTYGSGDKHGNTACRANFAGTGPCPKRLQCAAPPHQGETQESSPCSSPSVAGIPHEYPMPYTPYKIGVYIRYFNQTRHENYLEKHIQQYMDDIALCPQWTLVDFYVDKGMTAPHMEYSKEWCRLLEDCFTGKVNLIVTQKVSNVSSDWKEMSFMARMLAAQEHPVGIYFISEDIFTLASYYQSDFRDTGLLPEGWQTLPADELDEPMLSTLPKPVMPEQAEQMSLDEETDAVE